MTIEKLEKQIIEAKNAYYRGIDSGLTDAEYDQLEEKLRNLNPDSYVLQKVGYDLSEDKIPHKTPMLSLEKITDDPEALKKWVGAEKVVISQKMDGSAASIVYEDGLFKLAKTRGNGQQGENLSSHFQYIDVPKKLLPEFSEGYVEIRGELVISKTNFEKLCEELTKRGEDLPTSQRNTVAGLLHRKTGADLCKFLTFKAYDILTDSVEIADELDKFSQLTVLAFSTPCIWFAEVEMVDEALNTLPQIDKEEFLTDGLVIALNDLETQIAKGFTSHHPKGKIAYKFASEIAQTRVIDIEVNTGRTGKLSFVGIVDPVELSGAVVSRVTLHNAKYVLDHSVSPGCIIQITRSGEVIPKHLTTILSNDPLLWDLPSQCPVCGQYVEWTETKVDLVCTNSSCPAKAFGKLEHWVEILEIDSLGGETLKNLHDAELVKTPVDFYKLTEEDLKALPRMGVKSSRKIIKNIEKTREISIEKLLPALGVEGLGKGTSKVLVKIYPTLEDFYENCRVDHLLHLEGIGEVLAKSIVKGMTDFGWSLIQELRQLGVTIKDWEDPSKKPLNGLSFVITGSLSKPRNHIKNWIETLGGAVKGSVSAKTDYLVCNEKSSSSKSKKAEEMGIPVITEEELYEMVKK